MTAERQILRVCSKAALAITLLFGLMCAVGPASAQDVLLVIKNDTVPEAPTLKFTYEDLKKLPQVSITTHTEFTDGAVTFVGPLAREVLGKLPAGTAKTAHMVAANDYSHDIALHEFTDYDVILALEANGKRLSLRDKGPIWVMYPIDQHQELQDPATNARLVWQLTEIDLQ